MLESKKDESKVKAGLRGEMRQLRLLWRLHNTDNAWIWKGDLIAFRSRKEEMKSQDSMQAIGANASHTR